MSMSCPLGVPPLSLYTFVAVNIWNSAVTGSVGISRLQTTAMAVHVERVC